MMTFPADEQLSFETAPARLSISLPALVANWRQIAALAPQAKAGAAVKANAYGLGAEAVSDALARAGCGDFFVATSEEGRQVRRVAPMARIFVLSGFWPGLEETLAAYRLIPVLGGVEQVEDLRAQAPDLPFALMVDTGMNRLGLTPDQAIDFGQTSSARPVLLLSHLACSDEPAHPLNRRQLESFQQVRAAFEDVESSLSSSAGVLLGRDFHFDLLRPGIALYGGECGVGFTPSPVATAEARVLAIRHVKAGETASYGARHVFTRDARVAVLGAGYADGWHRSLSGAGVPLRQVNGQCGETFIRGGRAPIIGRISMDLTLIDVTEINGVAVGDYAELFGAHISVDEAARAAGTISYEMLTSLGGRYVRRVLPG